MIRMKGDKAKLVVMIFLGFLLCGLVTTSPVVYVGADVDEENFIENSGFETSSFSPWVNTKNSVHNKIQTDVVHNGEYALYMDTFFNTAKQGYHFVYQELDKGPTLDKDPRLRAWINPTKVGNTCGEAGISELILDLFNLETEQSTGMHYIWSGYTYPDGAKNVNITKPAYLLFNWVPNQWNLLNRNLLTDYSAVLGPVEDPSLIKVNSIIFLAHISNGDPGDFYVDDVSLSTDTSQASYSTWITTPSSSAVCTTQWTYLGELVSGVPVNWDVPIYSPSHCWGYHYWTMDIPEGVYSMEIYVENLIDSNHSFNLIAYAPTWNNSVLVVVDGSASYNVSNPEPGEWEFTVRRGVDAFEPSLKVTLVYQAPLQPGQNDIWLLTGIVISTGSIAVVLVFAVLIIKNKQH